MIYEIIGIIAGLTFAGASLPQLINLYQTKNTAGISIATFCVLAISAICRIIYGNYLNSLTMIVFNSISFCFSLATIVMTMKYRKN